MIETITYQRVIELVESVRPQTEPPRQGCVEGAIGNAAQAAAYYADEDDSANPLHVAAHLLRSLARDHCFVDGNKRVAWLACLDVLGIVGVTVECDQVEAAEFVESIATGSVTAAQAVHWLSERLVKIDASWLT